MFADTWSNIFSALHWSAVLLVLVYYFYPKFFESTNHSHKNSPLYLSIVIYIALYLIVLLLYYFYSGKSNAEVVGIWKLKPAYTADSQKYDEGSKLMVPANGIVDLLSENDSTKYLSETFTFGFFVKIEHSSIESIEAEALKNNYKPYQLIVTVPGVYDIFIDPFHEMLLIEFHSYKTANYKVTLPTLKTAKWHQILISVEGRSADIYQNGILLKSVGLQNVIAARPGKPKVNMNPEMYASLALVQSWPIRMKEPDIISNYRWNTDVQGVPKMPEPKVNIGGLHLPFFNGFNFCIGSFCQDTLQSDALSYVNYEYA